MDAKIRLKASFFDEFRYFTVSQNITFDALSQLLFEAYGTYVTIRYEDDDSDLITIRSPADLRTAFEGVSMTKSPPTLRVVLSVNEAMAKEIEGGLEEKKRALQLAESFATKLLETAKREEPEITAALEQLAFARKGVLIGLDHRFKTLESLTRKMYGDCVKDSKSPVTPEMMQKVAENIKDSLRYTLQFETENYTESVDATLKMMHDSNTVNVMQVKNFWVVAKNESETPYKYTPSSLMTLTSMPALAMGLAGMTSVRMQGGQYQITKGRTGVFDRDRRQLCKGDEYQGINSVLQSKASGMMWELQFHTKESLEVKEASHKIYEIFRIETDPVKKHEQYQEMVQMWDSVPHPEDVESLGAGVGAQPAPELPPIPENRVAEWEQKQKDKSRALIFAREILANWISSREEAITTALMKFMAVKYQSDLLELNDRLLGKYQIRWEISRIAEEKGVSFPDAASQVSSSLRYITQMHSLANFGTDVSKMLSDMAANGYTLVSRLNGWSTGDVTKGVEAVLRTPGNRLFTVQFHTVDSVRVRAANKGHGDSSKPDLLAEARTRDSVSIEITPGGLDLLPTL